MSSEDEKPQSSLEYEGGKRPPMAYEEMDRRHGRMEEQQMRYHPNGNSVSPHQMAYRHGMEAMMMRPGMPRPISPRMPQAEDSDLTDAMIFLNRIKEEFSDNLHVYDSFLETMRDFRFEKIDADEVCKAVRILFKDKPHIIRLFDDYLPHHLRYPDVNRGFDMQRNERHKGMPFRGPAFIPKGSAPMHLGQVPHGSGMHMSRMGHPMPPHPSFIGRPVRQSPSPQTGDQPPRFKQPPIPQPMPPQSPRHKTAHDFVHQVKKRYLNKPLVYRQFVELLQNSKNSFEKLYTQVSALLCDSPDLIEKFERNFKTPQSPTEAIYTVDTDPLRQIKEKLADQGNLEPFLKAISFYNQNYLSADNLIGLVEPLIGDKENITAFKSFINYEDAVLDGEPNRNKEMEKIGSYKILPVKIKLNTSSSLSREVLNCTCVSVSTHESEDDTYVFRHKNHSEDLLCRILDERSESDLLMDRLKYLIVRLEELYEAAEESELDLDDIKMSSSLVKETLKIIYENKSSEILEAILTNHKKAIPVVLKRLNKVFKDNVENMRPFKKFWRDMVEEHYYKAYDTKGVFYRSQEKNYLSLRNIQQESMNKHVFIVKETEQLMNLRGLFQVYVKSHTSTAHKRLSAEMQLKCFDSVISDLKRDSVSRMVSFGQYSLYYYILTLYSRLEEIRALQLEPISSNPMAVSIALQEGYNVSDRYNEIMKAAHELMSKQIDADRFEDTVRRMTECMGYKIYNFKKIMSKIEKQVNSLIDESNEEMPEDSNDKYSILKIGDAVTICRVMEEAAVEDIHQ